MPRKKPAKSKFTRYVEGFVKFHDPSVSAALQIRSTIKWVFDLLRNVFLIGLLRYLGEKTSSPILENLSYVGMGLLYAYCYTYFDTWTLHPFDFMKNKKRARHFNALFAGLVVGLCLGAVHYVLNKTVDALVTANAAQQNPEANKSLENSSPVK